MTNDFFQHLKRRGIRLYEEDEEHSKMKGGQTKNRPVRFDKVISFTHGPLPVRDDKPIKGNAIQI